MHTLSIPISFYMYIHVFFSVHSCQITVAYGYFHDYPITTYGESILLAMQSYVIVALAIRYSNDWSLENGTWFVGNGLFIALVVTKVIPAQVLSLLLVSTRLKNC